MYSEVNNLLALSRRGDIEAKEKLILKLKPLILASIKRYYNKIEEYDDLVQEGYEVILEGIKEFDETRGAKFLGYIKLKLKYHYLNKYKKVENYCSLNAPIGDGELEVLDTIEGEEIDPLDNLLQLEIEEELRKAIKSLTKRQKQIIIESYINGLSIGEIAKKLNISYRTVANTKTNAINNLKNKW